jgi:hypothetical protein
VMMGPGPGAGMNRGRPAPKLFRTGPVPIHRGGANHSRRLRRVVVECVGRDDPYPLVAPVPRRTRIARSHIWQCSRRSPIEISSQVLIKLDNQWHR